MSSPELIPDQYLNDAKEAAAVLADMDKVLIATHINPDGDAIGAAMAVAGILQTLGKQAAIYAPTGVPAYLDFMTTPCPVLKSLSDFPFTPQNAIFVDCSETSRLGHELAPHARDWPSLNIDHHLCEHGLGSKANFINHHAAATCQLVAYLAHALNLPLKGDMAEAIAIGVLTDTGHFSHGNTSGEIFSLCAELERNGCHVADMAEKLNHVWTLRRLNIWGKCFQKIHIACHGKLAWCMLDNEEIRQFAIGKDDMEGFVDVLRKIVGIEIGVFGREMNVGQTRFSLRSRGKTNVQEIAAALGGGGHRNAAGITIEGDPENAIDQVIEACCQYLENCLE